VLERAKTVRALDRSATANGYGKYVKKSVLLMKAAEVLCSDKQEIPLKLQILLRTQLLILGMAGQKTGHFNLKIV
jgi:hypothetical protein